jgi:hypothetical protein
LGDAIPPLSAASSLVSFACEVAIIVVIATVVRRYRPDAWKPILVWSIAAEAVSRLKPFIVGVVQGLQVQGGDNLHASISRGLVLNQLLGIPLTIALTGLLIHALLVLARPPKATEPPASR